MAIEKLQVEIGGNNRPLKEAIAEAKNYLVRLGQDVSTMQTTSAAALSRFGGGLAILGGASAVAATAVATHFASITKSAIDAGDQLNKMSQKTGIGAEELSKLQYAAELSDVSTEQLTKGLSSLAVAVVAAGTGSGESAKLFEKLGISVRNADGTMKSSSDILGELADIFAVMPDGLEKTNLAISLFGKKVGAEMIPLLNQGAAGLKAMGEEAEKFGLVMGEKFAKQAEDFNDNMKRFHKLSEATGITIGTWVVPKLNELMVAFLNAKKEGLSFWEIMNLRGIGLADSAKIAAEQVEKLGKKIEKLKTDLANAEQHPELRGIFFNPSKMREEIASLERTKKFYEAQLNEGVEREKEYTAKLTQISQQRQRKLAELESLRKIAAGEASADILKDDATRTDEQIKNAQRLKDALQRAWEATRDEAKKAGEEAAKLFERAAEVRQSAKDKASAIADKGLTPEEINNKAIGDFQAAAQAASFSTAVADAARLDGRADVAKKAAEQAAKDAERAMKFAEKITDDGFAQKAVEQAGDLQAKALESQARQKQQEQTDLTKRAEDQASLIRDLDGQLAALQTKAAAIKVSVDIKAAEDVIAGLNKSWDETVANIAATPARGTMIIEQKTVTTDGGTASVEGHARGGYIRGPGTGSSDSILARLSNGEFIVRAAAVAHYGPRLMDAINQMRLPRFASGGLVSGLRVPSMPAFRASGPSGTPVNLHIGGHVFQTLADADVAKAMTNILSREALKKSRR